MLSDAISGPAERLAIDLTLKGKMDELPKAEIPMSETTSIVKCIREFPKWKHVISYFSYPYIERCQLYVKMW